MDKLLNLVDKDIAQLSQVKVGGGAGSPSLDTQVSTVSRQESTIGKTPYAVFVITNEMIRRSGAKTIPDVLRMAPGVEVAQIDSNKWAISIRGINWRFTNHLLVQIDGRMVYTPLFGCVFWDVQDLLLEDVERIEVIRGPGASIWGANAVNGIINIITKNAKNTQGAYVESGTGTEELGFSSVRYGGGNGDDFHYRFFGKWFERGPGFLPDMIAADDWRQARGGFRMDWEPGNDDAFTFQGQYYNGYSGSLAILPQFSDPYYQMVTNDEHVSGEDVILHWKHRIDEQSDWAAMVYYDRTERHWLKYNMGENRDTFVADWQHRFPLGERHEVIWGVNYRTTRGEAQDSTFFGMIPPERSDYFLSYFAQDQITLVEDRWYLTLGSKFENNSFTGFEYQPTVRVLWTPDHKRSIWGAVSRAVRIPSWAEVNGYALLAPIQTDPVVVYPFIMGNPLMISEELIAYECGYREQTTERFSWDLALYLFDYRHIGTVQFDYPIPGPDFWIMPGMFANKLIGQTYGFEWTGNYRVTPHWTLRGNYTFMILTFNPVPGSKTPEAYEGESPRNQFYLQSSWDLGRNWELDLTGRYVDSLPYEEVPSYFAADLRLAWRPRKNFEWSVVGRNLLAGAHPEYGNDLYFGTIRTEVQEEVYTQLIFRH
ncbi:MAG: TonB-dependent receptor [Pirellulales bacterium]|nr:TonB-dependent receptor [Pirellulales bacterium]